MLAWLAPLLVLGLVIFVHELGHFLAAKLVGVYAPRFSLGWGSPLWKWRPKGGETEYVISWLPIGGYVRMASRDDETMSKIEGGNEKAPEVDEPRPAGWDPDAMVPHGPHPVPENRWFESKPTIARVFILLAGVTMNAILTLVVAIFIFLWYGIQVAPTVVPAVVDTVVADRPAARAGFQKGDSVTAVNEVPIREWGDFLREVTSRPGQPLKIQVVRADVPLTLAVTPEAMQEPDSATGAMRTVGRIGMGPLIRGVQQDVGVVRAFALGWDRTLYMGGQVIGVVKGLFSGSVAMDTLGGPIAIARASVNEARAGMINLLSLIAFLSINLAVLNLLPVPILDGGQILITVTEGVRGKPFSIRTRENLMKAGVAFIMVLFAIVMFNDIKSLVVGWLS